MHRYNLHGIQLDLPPALLTAELRHAFESGYYESSELHALSCSIKPSDRVLELGGGIGFISSYLMRNLNASAVCTIEANDELIPVIEQNHRLNEVEAKIMYGVAANRDGESIFHKAPSFWASSTISNSSDVRRTLVPSISTNRIIKEFKPTVLVVDIEGGENRIFERLYLDPLRTIIVEVHKKEVGLMGINRCFSYLMRAGFTYDPDGSGGSNVVFSRRKQIDPVKKILQRFIDGW